MSEKPDSKKFSLMEERISKLERKIAKIALNQFSLNIGDKHDFNFEELEIMNPHLPSHKNLFLICQNNSVLFLLNAKKYNKITFTTPTNLKIPADVVVECNGKKLVTESSQNVFSISSKSKFSGDYFSFRKEQKFNMLINACRYTNV